MYTVLVDTLYNSVNIILKLDTNIHFSFLTESYLIIFHTFIYWPPLSMCLYILASKNLSAKQIMKYNPFLSPLLSLVVSVTTQRVQVQLLCLYFIKTGVVIRWHSYVVNHQLSNLADSIKVQARENKTAKI